MADATYQKFLQRWEEVTDISPQSLGPFTVWYKRLTKRIKVMPWPWFVIASFFVVCVLYLVFGSAITGITSILQRAF